ncbi:bacteriophage Gp15 family protein [[Ruminococcus] torques]|nr:bacteriophage Gp15 family protein [[Ruminococcus] torques]
MSGVEYPIHADFHTVLRCFEIQGRKAELSEDDLLFMLRLFYNVKRMTVTEEHIDWMFWFFSCGREKEKKKFPRKIAGLNDKQPFDFEEDADLIYAGFMQQYGIDLQESDMHWWKFMILLENLGNGTRLQKVMEYRTIDTGNKNLSKTEQEFYRAMQRYYGLEQKLPPMSEKERLIEEALIHGGDVSKLL